MRLTEGLEAVIPVISLVALLCGDAETVSGGTRQHQNVSSEASSRYSRSTVPTGLGVRSLADAADAGNFGGNACSDALQQRPVKLGNFSGHNVNGVDAANDAGRLSGSMQSSFEFGWNALLLARRISHIC